MTEIQVAWLAGLFEGEGCIYLRKKDGSPVLLISMTDEDIICRVYATTGVGYVNYREPIGKKSVWRWSVQKWSDVGNILETLLPLLGIRRAEKARIALLWLQEHPPKRLKTHCIRGHLLSGHNLRITEWHGQKHRRCRRCLTDHQIAYNRRQIAVGFGDQ